MKIGIIGAGSIGLLFAAYLSKTCPVTVYTRTIEQREALNRNGIVLVKKGNEWKRNIQACQIEQWNSSDDLTIVAVKQYQVEEIINKIKRVNKKPSNILFLQNGMSHLKLLASMEGNNLFVGSVEHGAYKENLFTVKHNGEGLTKLAHFSGDQAGLDLFSTLVPDDFPVCIMEDYYEMLLNKLIINAIINPLTAILSVPNGQLLTNNHYYCVMKDLFSELASIFDLKNPGIYFDRVFEVCKNTALNRSSMLKDIESGRNTEIDAILGFVLEEAQKQEKLAPIATNLYHLIKGKEHHTS